MKLLAVSFKECWQDAQGRWYSDGGFPLQMGALATLFDHARLLVVGVPARAGGVPIPPAIDVVAMRRPKGRDLSRKLSVLARAPYYLRTFAREIAKADVVHTPLPGDLPLLAMLVAAAKKKRLLARYGGSWRANAESTLATRATRALMRRLARGRSVMLATGDAAAVSEPGIAAIFSTSLSSRELESAVPALSRPLSAPPRLVYAGRLSKEKGVDVLLRALAQLPGPTLTVAGGGPERDALGTLADQLGVSPRVRFVGQRDRAELFSDLDGADLCVQASRTEGFSKAWLDAMAHGLPVVSSDVGAARAVVGADGERGWLVPPGDPMALARKLKRVLQEPRDWPALRRRCRAFAEGKTLEAWALRIGEICAKKWDLELVEGKLR